MRGYEKLKVFDEKKTLAAILKCKLRQNVTILNLKQKIASIKDLYIQGLFFHFIS